MMVSINKRLHEALEASDLCWWEDVEPEAVDHLISELAKRGIDLVDRVTFAEDTASKIPKHLVAKLCP